MTIFTSNGFANAEIFSHAKALSKRSLRKVAIIVSAVIPQKAGAPWVKNVYNFLTDQGIPVIDYIDIEFEKAGKLLDYDLLYFMGGNPYHLLHYCRERNLSAVLKECLGEHRIIIGRSSSSMVLSAGIRYVEEFNTILGFANEYGSSVGPEQLAGLGLLDNYIFPHFSEFLQKVPDLDDRLTDIELRDNVGIIRLNDGEAIISNEGELVFV